MFSGTKMEGYRKEQSITRAALAQAVGVTEMTLYNWSKGVGKPDADNVLRLASCLGVDLMDLYEEEKAS